MPTTEAAVRNRRAVGLVLLSALLPASAQFVSGHRGLGRWALRIWGALLAVGFLLIMGLLLWRGPTVGLLLSGPVTAAMRVIVWVVFAGWLLLLIDAWRLTRPPELTRRARLVLTGGCVGLVLLAGLGTSLAASAFTAAGHVSEVLEGGGDAEAKRGRYNVLLLGVDAAADREGLRPDSINVASIDVETGRTVLLGLPRNLMGVRFPDRSPLKRLYPDGYRCGEDCMLNGVYTLGQDHADLYPGKEAGLEAMKEAVSETLGLELNYYAMVDLAGFQNLIDVMGGIRLDIGKRVPIGGVGSDIYGWIEPGENVHLDGYRALWFARSRADSDDYERMVRQKCVMSAMARQLDPGTVASRFADLAAAGSDIVRTDVGTGDIAQLVDLALQGSGLPLDSVNFAPPLINTGRPDFAVIRATVEERIAASQQLERTAPTPMSSAPESAESTPQPRNSSPQPTKTTGSPTPSVEPERSDGEAETPVCRVS